MPFILKYPPRTLFMDKMLLTLTLFIFTFFIGQNKAFDSLSKVGCLDLKPFDPIYIQDTPIPFKESTYVWTYISGEL